MAEGSGSPDISVAKPELSAEGERYQAAKLRQKLEDALLRKGLIVPVVKEYSLANPDSKGNTTARIETFEVPQKVADALEKQESYGKIGGINRVDIRDLPQNGTASVQVRFTNLMNTMDTVDTEPTLDVSVGKAVLGNTDNHLRTIIHGGPNNGDLTYTFGDTELKPTQIQHGRGNFKKMETLLDKMLKRIDTFPDDFKPSITQRIRQRIRPRVVQMPR